MKRDGIHPVKSFGAWDALVRSLESTPRGTQSRAAGRTGRSVTTASGGPKETPLARPRKDPAPVLESGSRSPHRCAACNSVLRPPHETPGDNPPQWQSPQQQFDGVLLGVLVGAALLAVTAFLVSQSDSAASVMGLFLFAVGITTCRLLNSAARVVAQRRLEDGAE